MTASANYSCYLGTQGWDHQHWRDNFYPSDLPEEWRLAFYNNVFNCVFLHYSVWSSVDLKKLAAWSEDTGEHFKFVLQAPRLQSQDQERFECLHKRIGLVIDDKGEILRGKGECVWLQGEVDLKSLANRLQTNASYAHPLYLLNVDADLTQLEKVKTLLNLLGLA